MTAVENIRSAFETIGPLVTPMNILCCCEAAIVGTILLMVFIAYIKSSNKPKFLRDFGPLLLRMMVVPIAPWTFKSLWLYLEEQSRREKEEEEEKRKERRRKAAQRSRTGRQSGRGGKSSNTKDKSNTKKRGKK